MKLLIDNNNFFIKLVYYFCAIALCAFLFLIGKYKFDNTFIIVLFLPVVFMFFKQKEIENSTNCGKVYEVIENKEQVEKFDFASYIAGLFIDFFITVGIIFITLLLLAVLKWYRAMILFLNLLIDAFVAKNIFFTRFGLRKFKYFYKESVGTVLKNSICVFAFLATLFLTGFLSKDRLKTQSIWLIIMYAFYFLCFLISVISLYKKKFVLTDLFKIQRYRIS